jgi:hypothetical protein
MFVRITTARGVPNKLATGLVAFRKGLRSGITGASVLVDHATGTFITVSRWKTREDAETASELTPIMQRQVVGLFGISEPLTHEIFEVAVDA